MNRIQKLIIAFLGICVLCVFVALFVVGAQTVRQMRAAQNATLPTPSPFPTQVYPSTYTPIPTSPPPTAVIQSGTGGAGSPGAGSKTPRPRATIDPNNPAAVAIEASFRKLQDVKSMRFEMEMTMQGDFGSEIPSGFVKDGQAALLGMSGVVADKDSHIVIKGMLAAILGANPAAGIEIMSVDGKSYLRGPIPMFGVLDDQWYIVEGSSKFSLGITDADQFVSGMEEGLNVPGISKSGVEQLDGLSCDVYVADKQATLAALQDLDQAQSQLPTSMDLNAIDVAETKIWVCADGLFHQLETIVQGKSKNSSAQKMGMRIFAHMYDFNSNIVITPPPNAKPMQLDMPGFSTPTPLAQ